MTAEDEKIPNSLRCRMAVEDVDQLKPNAETEKQRALRNVNTNLSHNSWKPRSHEARKAAPSLIISSMQPRPNSFSSTRAECLELADGQYSSQLAIRI
ncbi:unnamed protein product [Gongylonema pulchrum]|uniref:Uncharacterized protein n=1 Tax=Gongylonema pulchrum TaxID=637853 RepID=A0A183CY73_9BILA|nr:unnamed protein product [Gongylonema pulchrum]